MKTNKYYLLCLGLILTGCQTIHAQSDDHNYIKTRTMLSADGTQYIDNIQYFDGLGRPNQIIEKGVTPGKSDLISHLEYDTFGREGKAWIPTPVAGNNGKFVSDITTKAVSYHGDNNPYSEPIYEPSPLNRVVKQMGPGNYWHSAGKGVTTEYLTNTESGVLSAIYYKVTTDGVLSKSGNYSKGELYVEKTADEDGNLTYTFTDKLGQLILSRQINKVNGTDQYHNTYIVYDDFGNKRYVLTPMIEGNISQENLDLYA